VMRAGRGARHFRALFVGAHIAAVRRDEDVSGDRRMEGRRAR
jgi:hypothetical protein